MAEIAGHGASDLRAAGVPSTIEIVADPAGGNTAVTHAKVTITGMAEHTSDIGAALKLLSDPRSLRWAGGPGIAPLKTGGGIPALTDATAATLPPADLVGGGGMAAIYIAKLVMLRLASDATTNITIGTSATWLTSLLDLVGRTDALALVLACSPAAVGALPPPPTAALVAERQLVTAALCALLNATPDHLLAAALAKLEALAALGVTVNVAAGGMALRTAALEMQSAPPAVSAAHPPAPAAAPAVSTSPRDVQLAAQAAELAVLREGLVPPPAPPALAPSPLVGMDLLRLVSLIPGTSPAPSDLQLFIDVGGEVIIRRLAGLAYNPDPIIFLVGPGSLATAKEAGADFTSILHEARAAIPAGSISDAVLRATAPPVDTEESASRVRTVIRMVEQHRRSMQPQPLSGGAGGADGSRSRLGTDRGSIKSIPVKADAERAWRACSAAVVNALGSADELRKATLQAPLSDPIAEARRLIDLHGNKTAGVLLSSGEADGDITHEPHPSILASRTALANHAKQHALAVALPSRAKEIAAEALALRESVIAVDIKWGPILKIYGGIQPQAAVWRAARQLSASVVGRWRLAAGDLSYGDSERAARLFGSLLSDILCTVGGAPPPAEPTMGLLPLVQSTQQLSDAARMELLNEAFERIGQEHQLRRQDADAAPVDGEAIFMDATKSGVQPISDAAANMQAGEKAGAAAGVAAAAEYCAAFAASLGAGKRAPPSPVSPAPQAGVEQVKKKLRGGTLAKEKARAALAGIVAGGAASSAIVIAGATVSATAAGTAAAGAFTKVNTATKMEPFAAGEPKADSITTKLDKLGGGLVEVLDRLHVAENPQAKISELACPWMSTNGSCRDGDKGACKKCSNKTQHSAATLSTAKAACSADLLNSLPAKSLVKAAA
jgi:hypothetical protein